MSKAFSEPHLTSTSLPVPLFYSSFSNTYHNPSHIFPYIPLLLATNNSSLLTPLSFIFPYIWLLVYHDTARLCLPLMLHPLAHTLFSFLTPNSLLFATLLLMSFLPLLFSSLPLLQLFLYLYSKLFLFFLLYLLQVLLLLPLINYKSNSP